MHSRFYLPSCPSSSCTSFHHFSMRMSPYLHPHPTRPLHYLGHPVSWGLGPSSLTEARPGSPLLYIHVRGLSPASMCCLPNQFFYSFILGCIYSIKPSFWPSLPTSTSIYFHIREIVPTHINLHLPISQTFSVYLVFSRLQDGLLLNAITCSDVFVTLDASRSCLKGDL